MPEVYQIFPSNFVGQQEVNGLVYQVYRSDVIDPWRVKMIGVALGQFVVSVAVALLITSKVRPYAMGWGLFLLFRLWLELTSGDPWYLFWVELAALVICLASAYLWNLWGPRLRVVWNRWRN